MHYVSLIIEFLRGRPRVVFWALALTQAVLWTAIPSLVYGAPPGEVPIVLAIGHEFVLGSYLGPPLAFWLGEAAFRLAGAFGLYALAQACIVLTYWAVFALGRAIVGIRHAVLAVLLMVGIAVFSVSGPAFGPPVLAAPFWALALLFYWRAIGEAKRGYWFLLAVDLGLLLLADYVGLILITLIILFTLATSRGRRALGRLEPWLALPLTAIVVFPHAWWLFGARDLVLSGLNDGMANVDAQHAVLWLAGALIAAHLGLLLLVGLASGWPRKRHQRAPEIDRGPVEPLARWFVYGFALAPALLALVLAFLSHRLGPLNGIAPLVVLSGLAVIVAAGDRVLLYRERLVSSAWLGLLVVPPALVVAGIVLLPWIAQVDPQVALPAKAEGRFFADTFQRRTGKPLMYVAGDPRVAPLVALGAPSRPHVYFAWAPERSPWATPADLRAHGGVLVWVAADNRSAPPAGLKAQFPDMVAEVPRDFARPVQGLLPLIHLGWAVIRPPVAQP
jgi:4-amino-4-deoxy-L-arabinose transferase-like glycosyltransferase